MFRIGRAKGRNVTKRGSRTRSRTPYVAKRSRVSYAKTTKAISAPSVGLGQSARTILKTVTVLSVSAPANGIANFYLSPGSCFKPLGDIQSSTQPTLYDQWAATYGRYVVEKAYVRLEIATAGFNAGGTNSATVFAAYPSVSTTALNTFSKVAGQDFAKSVLLGPTDVTSSNVVVFKLDHAKVLGRKGGVTAEDNGSSTNSDPPTNQFMVLPCILQNPQAAVYTWNIRVVMYQTVHFDRRIPVVDA